MNNPVASYIICGTEVASLLQQMSDSDEMYLETQNELNRNE